MLPLTHSSIDRPVHGGNLTWAANVAGCSPSSLLDFSASISPLGPPQSVIAAIQSALTGLSHYPDPGYGALCCYLADYHQMSTREVLPGNGAAELLTWACRDLAMAEATLLLVPAFSDYDRGLRAFNGNVVSCGLQSRGSWLSAEAVVEVLLRRAKFFRRPGLLFNNPHNPTGQLWDRECLQPLLEVFDPLVVDEAFMDFLPPEQQQSLMAAVVEFPNLVVLRSQTKFYSLPGLRLGYAVGSPERLQRWQHWRDPWPVNNLAVAAGMAALDDQAYQERTWTWLHSARMQLHEGLQAIDGLCPLPGSVNFFLVRCRYSVPLLQQALLKNHRILIRDCLSFAELGEHYFRVAVKTEADNQRLLGALAAELAKTV